MWDERFSTDDYVYGTAPSGFLQDQAAYLTPGASRWPLPMGKAQFGVHG